ncbi:preprotein translocase subunit SecE [Actinophytocola sp.]|uniref:preprotein translocase subunit SecE n=1 Tax=Actinophytocola sp. TaxID=1872138 RepID=UPI002D248E25|nr:preprotein translocase subunit SecE [Actinophytocola sp.]HYQ69999.1 preprotein translocase subunit SecE [Actinophytocola sp.]
MVDDRDKEESKGQERPSRPVTAAARRERRASARPAARKESSTDEAAKPARSKSTADEKAKPKAKAKADAKTDAKGEHKKGRPTPTRDHRESRPGFFARIWRFLKEVVAELRKVIWPTRKQMITYTAVVLVFVAFMVAVIAGFDFALAKGVFALFG